MGKFEEVAKKSVMQIKPYVPGKPVAAVQRELGLKDVIKLASNENPLGPSKAAVKAMAKALDSLNLYPESGAYELRQALAKKLKVKPDTLFFGNGSNELLQLIAEAFKAYARNDTINIPLLSEYAEKLKVAKKARTYMEVLL